MVNIHSDSFYLFWDTAILPQGPFVVVWELAIKSNSLPQHMEIASLDVSFFKDCSYFISMESCFFVFALYKIYTLI